MCSEPNSYNIGPICCPKTLVKDYRLTLHSIPEELRSEQVW
jgi:hypothetical protein